MNKPERDKDGYILTFDIPIDPPFTFTINNLQKLVSLYRCLHLFYYYSKQEGIGADIPVIDTIIDAIEKFRPDIIEEKDQ